MKIFSQKKSPFIDTEALLENFLVNAIGPCFVPQTFKRSFPKRGKSVFVSLSARVGSVGDNHLGGGIAIVRQKQP